MKRLTLVTPMMAFAMCVGCPDDKPRATTPKGIIADSAAGQDLITKLLAEATGPERYPGDSNVEIALATVIISRKLDEINNHLAAIEAVLRDSQQCSPSGQPRAEEGPTQKP